MDFVDIMEAAQQDDNFKPLLKERACDVYYKDDEYAALIQHGQGFLASNLEDAIPIAMKSTQPEKQEHLQSEENLPRGEFAQRWSSEYSQRRAVLRVCSHRTRPDVEF